MANDSKQQENASQSHSKAAGQNSGEETPSMNVLEATGVALYKNVDESAINSPAKGEVKRSLRLTRLLMVMALAVLGFIIVIALLFDSISGWLKLVGTLVFLAFTARCSYVSYALWRKLK